MNCNLIGKVKKVGDVQTFASGFTKRSVIVVEQNPKTKYPPTLCVDFTKNRTDMLDGIRIGDEVTIQCSVEGREWEDPKSGNIRYFTSLNGFKISVANGDRKAPEPATPPDDMAEEPPDEMPF